MNEIGNKLIVLILVLALLHIISPVDFIPDSIPVVGWVDDVAVGVGAGAVAITSKT